MPPPTPPKPRKVGDYIEKELPSPDFIVGLVLGIIIGLLLNLIL